MFLSFLSANTRSAHSRRSRVTRVWENYKPCRRIFQAPAPLLCAVFARRRPPGCGQLSSSSPFSKGAGRSQTVSMGQGRPLLPLSMIFSITSGTGWAGALPQPRPVRAREKRNQKASRFSWFCSLSQRRFSSVHLHAGAENLSGLQIFIGWELKEGGLELTVVDFPLLGAYAGPAGAAGRGRLLQLDPSVIPAQETTAKLPRPSGLVFFARQADLDIWQAGLARNEEDGLHTNGQTIFLVFRVSRP